MEEDYHRRFLREFLKETKLSLETALLQYGIYGMLNEFEVWLDQNGLLRDDSKTEGG